MNETEAHELWNHVVPFDREEIGYHAYLEAAMTKVHTDNQEAVRRGTVGAGVLSDSAAQAARARLDLHASIERAIARAKAERDRPQADDVQTTANTPDQ